MKGRHLFTSESVTEGHPDKVADQISDAVLDACLAQDPNSKVACETFVTTGLAVVGGEITTDGWVDLQSLVRKTIREIGYTKPEYRFDCDSCGVINVIGTQSQDINRGVVRKKDIDQGAGDQGMMFGYACDETKELMPLPILLAHRLTERLAHVRRTTRGMDWLAPDGKSQVTMEYEGSTPIAIDTVVISTQHDDGISNTQIREAIIKHVIEPVLPKELVTRRIKYHINPTGRFVIGGPHGDAGLTGRKIIVDTYGGMGRHGGGAFSGKDPSKVDRSAAYACRYVAKNIVAAGLADRCEVQVSYAIGVAEPTSISVETFGTGKVDESQLTALVRKHFDLRPYGILKMLDLERPMYRPTAAYGHFGREDIDLTWERTDKAAALADDAGMSPRKASA